MEQEPIDTSTPWHRPRQEPWTLTDAERAAYQRAAVRAMTEPGNGAIHPMSITTPTYEPNRAMAPDPNSLIAKKGMKPPDADKVELTVGDRVVVVIILLVLAAIAGTTAAVLTRM